MRPRRCHRGKRGNASRPYKRFVIASMRPRRCHRGKRSAAGKHDEAVKRFNEAPALSPGKGENAGRYNDSFDRFNEAPALSPGKAWEDSVWIADIEGLQ